MKFKRIYVDMDGVLADFELGATNAVMHPKQFKLVKGVYRALAPIEGAIEALKELHKRGYDIEIATKLPHENPYSATEKLLWIEEHLPWLIGHVTITSDKGQLGDEEDILIDDRPHKGNVCGFKGLFLHFGINGKYQDWKAIMTFFDSVDEVSH